MESAIKTQIGLIGCGAWARKKYLPYLAKHPEVTVAAFCELVLPKEKTEISTLFPEAKYYETATQMLASEKLAGVVVTLPHSLHLSRILEALNHGLPVFTDKPAGVTADEIRQIVAAEAKSGKRVTIGSQRRALPGYTEIKRRLAQSSERTRWATGTFHFSSYPGWQNTWRNNPQLSGFPQAKQGVLLDTGYHLLDSLLYILDFPKPVLVFAQANYRGYQVETDVMLTVQFENELTMQLSVSRDATPHYEKEGIALLTDQQFLSFNLNYVNGVKKATLVISEQDSSAQILHYPITAIAHHPLASFLDYVAGNNFEETWSVASSLLTLEIIDAAYQSIQSQAVVRL